METNNPIKPILGRIAVLMASAWLVVPLTAGDPISPSGLSDRERARREASVQEAQELLLKGDEAYRAGRFSEAMEAFAAAREMFPNAPATSDLRDAATDRYALATVEHAKSLSRQGDVAAAKAAIDKVLEEGVAPKHPAALAMRAQLDDPIRTNPALTKEHAKNIDEVRRLLYQAEGCYNLGKFDQAKTHYEQILRIDPTNTAARRGMEQVATAKSAYQKSAYDHTRQEMLTEVDAAWETAVPAPELGGAPLDPGAAPVTDKTTTLSAKLDRIILPKVNFSDTTLDEALAFLRNKSIEFDTTATDADQKGVNFTLNLGPADSPLAKEIGGKKFDLQLNSVPLSRVLKYLTEMTRTSYQVDDFAVVITPAGTTSDELISRTYRVPPDFITNISTSAGGNAAAEKDPFASKEPSQGLLQTRMTVVEALKAQGVPFPEGANANYNVANGTLRVYNTAVNQDMISQLCQAAASKQPAQVVVHVTMIRTQRTLLKELGFDTLITPLALGGEGFLSGGTVGNGAPRTSGDFSAPMPGLPLLADGTVNQGALTNGLRSGDYAMTGNQLDAIVNNVDRNTQENSVAPGILAITGLFTDSQVQTIMRGFDQNKSADIMAQPSVVSRSGQQSTIQIVREFIYPTEYEPPQVPTSATSGSSAPVAPANPTAFEKKDVGISLEVLPVADVEKGMIDLTLNPSFSDFDGFVNYGSPIYSSTTDQFGISNRVELTKNAILMPVFSVHRLNTQISVYDGTTIAIGGLLSDTVQDVEDKVPVLGSLPLVGRMFSTKARKPISTAIVFLVRVELRDPTGKPFRNH